MLASCKKEDDLTGTSVTNWFERLSPTNTGAVSHQIDQKIYDIWSEYNFGVLYDTIVGFEGSGRFIGDQEIGNQIIISPLQNTEMSGRITNMRCPLVNLSTQAGYDAKASGETVSDGEAMVNMLTFIENVIAPFVVTNNVNLPGLLIVKDLYKVNFPESNIEGDHPETRSSEIFNMQKIDGSRVFVFNLARYKALGETANYDFVAEFISKAAELMGGTSPLDAALEPFLAVTENAIKSLKSDATRDYIWVTTRAWSVFTTDSSVTPNIYTRYSEIMNRIISLRSGSGNSTTPYNITPANLAAHQAAWAELVDESPQMYGFFPLTNGSAKGYIVGSTTTCKCTSQEFDRKDFMAYAFKYKEAEFGAAISEFSRWFVCAGSYTNQTGTAKYDGNCNNGAGYVKNIAPEGQPAVNVPLSQIPNSYFPRTMERFRLMKQALLSIGMDTDAMLDEQNAE